MKRFHLSLRFKLTAIVAGVMSVCCLLLTAVSLSTSAHMMEALPLTEPAIVLPGEELSESDGAACEPALIASAAHSTFRVQNLAAMVLVILAGSTAAYLLVRRQLRPLEQLAACVKTLDADNMEPGRLPLPDTRDESYQLALALEEMTGRVGQAYRMQKEFAASAAHELCTPLAAMQSRLEVFRMKERTPEEHRVLLARLGENLERLNTLVEQLLQLCSNQTPGDCRRTDLGAIAWEAAAELAGRGVEIQVEGSAFADGSPALYRQLTMNLMTNAVKYGGGRVRVSLQNALDFAQMRVEDNGPGIPPEMCQRIFEPFFRVDRSRCRALGGESVPAHADAESYSVFAMLGMLPAEAGFRAVELRRPELAAEYEQRGLLPAGLEVMASSDAHFLAAVGQRLGGLAPDSVLRRLL